jgi:hypothetical protein
MVQELLNNFSKKIQQNNLGKLGQALGIIGKP